MPEQNNIPATRFEYRKLLRKKSFEPDGEFKAGINSDSLPEKTKETLVDVKDLTGVSKLNALTFLFHTADCDQSTDFWRNEYRDAYSELLNNFIDTFCPELLAHIKNQKVPNFIFDPNPTTINGVVKNLFIIDVINEINAQLNENNTLPKVFNEFALTQNESDDIHTIRNWFLTESGLICYSDINDWSFIKNCGSPCY